MSRPNLLLIFIGLTIGNFVYAYFGQRSAHDLLQWEFAQATALVAVYLVPKRSKP